MKDNTCLLERTAVKEFDPEQALNVKVLAYAQQNLGYRHPEQSKRISRNKLSEAIRIIGLKPFTPQSVKQYQRKEASRRGVHPAWKKLDQMGNSEAATICLVLILIVALVLLAASFPAHWNLATKICFATFVASCATAFAIGVIATKKCRLEAKWYKYRLKEYEGPVPEFALATAQELHQRVPKVMFHVEELVVRERPRDPFLIAEFYDDEVGTRVEYYLEVWREPGYKQERMA